jgi:type I restriction enzyme R subunit
MREGSIDLSDGEADPLKGPTDVGTARAPEEQVALSSLIDKLNERFGTAFTEADQLFFDQIRASAEEDEKIVEAARANNLANFSATWTACSTNCSSTAWKATKKSFSRVMTDKEFRSAAHEHLAREIFRRVRGSA